MWFEGILTGFPDQFFLIDLSFPFAFRAKYPIDENEDENRHEHETRLDAIEYRVNAERFAMEHFCAECRRLDMDVGEVETVGRVKEFDEVVNSVNSPSSSWGNYHLERFS